MFQSSATNLVPGDTNHSPDIFVRDLLSSVTERVSVDSAGNQANANSHSPALSADGRYVVFQSYASNLVPGDTNAEGDIFVRDRLSGTTERISVDSAGNQGNRSSFVPAISVDGRIVSFESDASNLVSGDVNLNYDVFVHDRVSGITELVSVDSAGNQANRGSTYSALSADGRYVAFHSLASNLVPGDTNLSPDVFLRDRVSGTTEAVSNSGVGDTCAPVISADGRYVAFFGSQVYVRDRVNGLTECVSVDPSGTPANAPCYSPSLSADGRYLAFQTSASNLVQGDTIGHHDVFVLDRSVGTTLRMTLDLRLGEANGDSGAAALSADGGWIAFISSASDLVVGDTNLTSDVFVRPLRMR